jgi:hypothetical protein
MSKGKRTYTKRNKAYWENRGKVAKSEPETAVVANYAQPKLVDFKSQARQSNDYNGTRTKHRRNESSKGTLIDRYSNIHGGLLPWEASEDNITVRDAIELCQKAYANIALFRNVIDMMSEFANSDLYLEDGTKESRKFFEAWMKKINIWNLTDQYFREYFRGGNIFMMRVDGKFSKEDFLSLVKKRGFKKNNIALKYIMLNPKEIAAKHVGTYDENAYEKMLSQYDLKRLKNPVSDDDKKFMQSLPPDVRKRIKQGEMTGDGIYIPIDPNKLYFSFYKKQDYEAFGVPFGWPVLADLNMKQEFKNMDAAIMRTVENVILMITNGAEPDKGGINAKTINDIQELFENESTGRVLVADYTTKGEFIIPDLKKVLGKEKYEVLNQDIKDGLQNIMLADDAHATADIKVKIFLDRLKEARKQFLNDFFQKELDRIGKELGYRKVPTAKFKEIDMKDDAQLMTIGTRLVELGILTPDQGMEFMRKGQLPKSEDMDEAQEEYTKKRKKGHYNPLVGGTPMVPPPEDPNKPKPMTPESKGRPVGATEKPSSKMTTKKLAAAARALDTLYSKAVRLRGGEENLTIEQKALLHEMVERIVASKDKPMWTKTLNACLKDPSLVDELSVKPAVGFLAERHNLGLAAAAILFNSLEDEV